MDIEYSISKITKDGKGTLDEPLGFSRDVESAKLLIELEIDNLDEWVEWENLIKRHKVLDIYFKITKEDIQ